MAKKFPLESKGFNPFGELIGLNFEICEEDRSRCVLHVKEDLMNPQQVLHGAVLYAMADTGMGAALYSRLVESEFCATKEIKINYFKAVKSGNLVCETRLINKNKTMAMLESAIRLEDILVAKACGTFSIFNREP